MERQKGDHYGDAFWAGLRDEYATGNESLSQIASRVNVPLNLIKRHAASRSGPNNGQSWTEWRSEFRNDVSRKVVEEATESATRNLAIVREKSANVSRLALEELERRLKAPEDGQPLLVENKDLVAAAKLATAVKIEIGGNADAPAINIQGKLDGLSVDELRKLAET